MPAYSAPSSLLSRAADMKYSERAEVVKAQHWTQLSGMGEKEGEEALARRSKKRAATLKGTCVLTAVADTMEPRLTSAHFFLLRRAALPEQR